MPEGQQNFKSATVGQYYLMEKISQGGMAEIYKGLSYDVHGLKKTVCIKKILPHLSANEEFISSLIDEAKLAVKLVHGNIAQTFDLGKVGGDYFMVMEYVEGRTLSQINKKCVLQGKLIPIPHLIYFISEVANALNYMHRRTDEYGNLLHIVHRDVSPQNIMISYSGTVKIIDFGIAKAAFKMGSTDAGMLKGKFAYMSPEQARGDEIDARSDIFSLGIILHEMLTGQRLFKADDSRQTVRNVRQATVEPPSAIRGDLPEDLDGIVMRALAKDRRRRYPFASEIHGDLVKFIHANYPEFKPSDAAMFMQELFGDEMKTPPPVEMDARTPHLIIDRSNSALADDSQFEATGRARVSALNLEEYMLDDMQDGKEAKDERRKPVAVGPDEEDRTGPLKLGFISFGRRWFKFTLFLAVSVISVSYLAYRFVGKPAKLPATVQFAEIVLVISPSDAEVFLDGRLVGRASPVDIKDILPDEDHTIEVVKEGFVTHRQDIKLSAGEVAKLLVSLDPAIPPRAQIEIITTPPGAIVFLDDQETSYRTPIEISDMPPDKEITIGVYLQGYRFWTKKVLLKGGEVRSFDVSLTKDFAALSIESQPPKALVMMDGVPVGQTPFSRDDLEPDRVYRIEVWHEGFVPFSQEIKPAAGRKEELHIQLTAEPKLPIQR